MALFERRAVTAARRMWNSTWLGCSGDYRRLLIGAGLNCRITIALIGGLLEHGLRSFTFIYPAAQELIT